MEGRTLSEAQSGSCSPFWCDVQSWGRVGGGGETAHGQRWYLPQGSAPSGAVLGHLSLHCQETRSQLFDPSVQMGNLCTGESSEGALEPSSFLPHFQEGKLRPREGGGRLELAGALQAVQFPELTPVLLGPLKM